MSFKVFESKTYREFLESRGENRTQLMRRSPSKTEISNWNRRQEDLLEC